MKPHVICHMVASIDGRTLLDRWRPKDVVAKGLFERVYQELRRFLKKKIPYQSGAAGRIRISHLGNCGWRSSRRSTASMAFLFRVMPRRYSL